MVSPGNRGYEVVSITTTWRRVTTARLRRRRTRPRFRSTRRHGMIIDSSSTRPDIFDAPCAALDEDDRHLADAPALPRDLEHGLHHERVAVRQEPLEVQPRQRVAPPAAVPARAVARGQPGDGADVAVRERAQDDAAQRPVHHADAVQVARAEHEVVVGRRRDEIRQVPRVVRQVRVHLADEVGVGARAPSGSRRDTTGPARARPSGASPAGARDSSRASSSATAPGAVGRLVVDDQHLVRRTASRIRGTSTGQVVALVVRRDDDRGRSCASRPQRPPGRRRHEERRVHHRDPEPLLGEEHQADEERRGRQQQQRDRQAAGPGQPREAQQRERAARRGTSTTDAPK